MAGQWCTLIGEAVESARIARNARNHHSVLESLVLHWHRTFRERAIQFSFPTIPNN
jgi:hypothetical protein